MKKTFPGHFPPSTRTLNRLWANCTFVVDANILLNLYRYSDDTRKEFLHVLRAVHDRVWIPHRAAAEYFSNRLGVIHQQERAYRDALDKVAKLKEILGESNRHPFVEDKVLKKAHAAFADLTTDLETGKSIHEKRLTSDSIRDDIAKIFSGNVGTPYSDERLAEIAVEGEDRYSKRVPPGYKDNAKSDNDERPADPNRVYGDLLVWFQLIDFSKANKADVIFITDDRKEDWWESKAGKTVGPRPELAHEFNAETNKLLHMYQADQFLNLASSKLSQDVDEDAITEVRNLRHRDAERNRSIKEQRKRKAHMRGRLVECSEQVNELQRRETYLSSRLSQAKENLIRTTGSSPESQLSARSLKMEFQDHPEFLSLEAEVESVRNELAVAIERFRSTNQDYQEITLREQRRYRRRRNDPGE